MLYHLFAPLQDQVSGFRLFQYITFRAAFAAVLAFLVAVVVGPGIVRALRARKIAGFSAVGQGAEDLRRKKKGDIPTMGGVILLAGVGLSGFLFARLDTPCTWILLLSFLAFGALGAWDDWRKLERPGAPGIRERTKLLAQVGITLAAVLPLYAMGAAEDGLPLLRGPTVKDDPYACSTTRHHRVEEGETWSRLAERFLCDPGRGAEVARLNGADGTDAASAPAPGTRVRLPASWPDPADHHRTDLQVPFVKGVGLDLGLLFIPFALLVVVGASNAVNLTDGQDGLAVGVTGTVAAAFAVVAYVVGRVDFSADLHLFFVPEAGELAVLTAALLGGSLGFLWFNAYPAEVFMGDTGSLALGGFLGILAVMLHHEVTLAIAGGVLVSEVVSVVLQRQWFRWTKRAAIRRGDPAPTGKRLFRITPWHHHFEQGGIHENKVTVRFWIASAVCALLALATLKTR
jgi:phospho-N-acetylmuramoyl-pentapeptide-transferase